MSEKPVFRGTRVLAFSAEYLPHPGSMTDFLLLVRSIGLGGVFSLVGKIIFK